MTAGHLIAFGDLSLLDNVDADDFVHTSRKRIFVLTAKYFNRMDNTGTAMGNTERGVFLFFGLFREDGLEKLFFRGRIFLRFRSRLANEDVSFFDFSTRDDDATFIEEGFRIFSDVGDITSNLFRT